MSVPRKLLRLRCFMIAVVKSFKCVNGDTNYIKLPDCDEFTWKGPQLGSGGSRTDSQIESFPLQHRIFMKLCKEYLLVNIFKCIESFSIATVKVKT